MKRNERKKGKKEAEELNENENDFQNFSLIKHGNRLRTSSCCFSFFLQGTFSLLFLRGVHFINTPLLLTV